MSNHRYNTPAEGTLDWHVPLNENFEALDTDVELRDVEANLGDYTPADGAKFLATDTGRVFLGDGEEWSELSLAGSDGGDGGSSRGGYRVVGSVDEIQPAVDALAGQGGGTVLVEAGEYDLTEAPIRPRSGVSILGAGMGETVFHIRAALDGEAISDPAEEDIVDAEFGHFSVNGHGYPDSGAIRIGNNTNPRRVVAHHVHAYNCAQTGLNFRRTSYSEIRNCVTDTCGGVSLNVAIADHCTIRDNFVIRPRSKNDGKIFENVAGTDGGTNHGISIEQSESCRMVGNVVQGDDKSHLALNANTHTEGVIANNVVRNVPMGFNGVRECRRNVIANNVFRNCSDHGIMLQNWSDSRPFDNLVAGNLLADCDRAIRLHYSGRAMVQGNYVMDARIGLHGYEMDGPPVVEGNTFARCSEAAIDLNCAEIQDGPRRVANNYAGGDVRLSVEDTVVMGNQVHGDLECTASGNRAHFNLVDGTLSVGGGTKSNNV